jgi:hypothetical protein
MPGPTVLIELPGVYGGRTSRDEIIRGLKEALALVENAGADAELASSGMRIDVLRRGVERAQGESSER